MTLPRPIPILLSALGVLVLLSTAVGIYLTFTQSPRPGSSSVSSW
ncbi:MAG TPA: hypothetical protein VFF65_04355 [Phycisphaerales bacterium]|nr:hypothetical protein [Phycisphaerales bacterium]